MVKCFCKAFMKRSKLKNKRFEFLKTKTENKSFSRTVKSFFLEKSKQVINQSIDQYEEEKTGKYLKFLTPSLIS